MKAMLLAAGTGERMLPLTRLIPKPATPVLGRPIAVQILQRLAAHGITSAVVNLHHLPDQMKSMLGDGRAMGLKEIHYSHESSILGTGGGIGKAASHLRGSGGILVHNADFLSDIDVRGLLSHHRSSDSLVTLVLAPAREGYTPIEVDAAGRVLSIGGRPEADPGLVAGRHMFTGCHVLDEEVLERVPSGRPSSIIRDVYLDLVEEGRVGSRVHSGFWQEFGTPADYLAGSLRLLDLTVEELEEIARTDRIVTLDGTRAAVGVAADFHNGVVLHGRVALGSACMVAEGTFLEDSIVMPGAWVGPGSRLQRVIVAPNTEIPAGFELASALVCQDTDPEGELAPGIQRRGGLLLRPLGPAPEP